MTKLSSSKFGVQLHGRLVDDIGYSPEGSRAAITYQV